MPLSRWDPWSMDVEHPSNTQPASTAWHKAFHTTADQDLPRNSAVGDWNTDSQLCLPLSCVLEILGGSISQFISNLQVWTEIVLVVLVCLSSLGFWNSQSRASCSQEKGYNLILCYSWSKIRISIPKDSEILTFTFDMNQDKKSKCCIFFHRSKQ